MKIYEFHPDTLFEFECDIVINSAMTPMFDNEDVIEISDLLAQHGVDFIINTGINEQHQRIVTIRTTQTIPEAFYYDLTSRGIMWR